MQINVSGKQVDLSDALRTRVASSLDVIAQKYFDHAMEANVTFSRARSFFTCDINVHAGRGLMLRGEGEAGDANAAFDDAAEHIAKRLRRYRRRVNEHHRDQSARAAPSPGRAYILQAEADTPDTDTPDTVATNMGETGPGTPDTGITDTGMTGTGAPTGRASANGAPAIAERAEAHIQDHAPSHPRPHTTATDTHATHQTGPHHDGHTPQAAGFATIIAETQTEIRHLTVGDAVMRMDLADQPVLMFRNSASGILNVVYRRPDGNIGWIDPGE